MKRRAQLEAAVRSRTLVRFTRPFEHGSVLGYILGLSARFLLVALVEDASRFAGFSCFRVSDVRCLEVPHRHAAFTERALRSCRARMPRKPPVNVINISELLLSAARAFPLVTIHREKIAPDVCEIGLVQL